MEPACFTEAFNASNYALNRLRINHGLSAQLNLQADGAIGKRYHIGSHLATFEFGGKFRNAHKFDDSYQITTSPNDGVSIPIAQFPSVLTNNNYYSGAYQLGPNPSYQAVQAFADANPSQFTTVSSQGTDTSNYDLVEKVSAGYLMNTIDFSSKFRLVAGVRFEATNLRTRSFDTSLDPPTFTVDAIGSYLKVLAERGPALCHHSEHECPRFLRSRPFAAGSSGYCAGRNVFDHRKPRQSEESGHAGKSESESGDRRQYRRAARTLLEPVRVDLRRVFLQEPDGPDRYAILHPDKFSTHPDRAARNLHGHAAHQCRQRVDQWRGACIS